MNCFFQKYKCFFGKYKKNGKLLDSFTFILYYIVVANDALTWI